MKDAVTESIDKKTFPGDLENMAFGFVTYGTAHSELENNKNKLLEWVRKLKELHKKNPEKLKESEIQEAAIEMQWLFIERSYKGIRLDHLGKR